MKLVNNMIELVKWSLISLALVESVLKKTMHQNEYVLESSLLGRKMGKPFVKWSLPKGNLDICL